MTQVDEIEKLQLELAQNPKSSEFVRLAELYLSQEMLPEAEHLVSQSLKFHPRSVSGLILLGRIFKIKNNYAEALAPLIEATRLAGENWRAWAELGESYLELKKGKRALEAFKKVLFLNPTHAQARRAVNKLEVLTADEYEEDLFQMQTLPETKLHTLDSNNPENRWGETPAGLIRILSYIDALIIRNDQQKAIDLLNDCTKRFGSHPEIDARRLRLSAYESSELIQPKLAQNSSRIRGRAQIEKKIRALKELLHRIELRKSQVLST
jgi:cytochrome c-type biogenesis protein CcmH/NrfG